MQILEIIATISGILCVFLQTREKILAWPLGILSVAISVFVFWRSQLFSDVLLHVVYIFLNIYGWWNWSKKQRSPSEPAPIILLSRLDWMIWPLTIALGTLVLGQITSRYLGASLPYFDAFTTVGSLVAQYLLARKILQNWLLWIVVDIVAINVYLYKDLYFFSALFGVYLVLCVYGYFNWHKELKTERAAS